MRATPAIAVAVLLAGCAAGGRDQLTAQVDRRLDPGQPGSVVPDLSPAERATAYLVQSGTNSVSDKRALLRATLGD